VIEAYREREERKYKEMMVIGNKEKLKEFISILLFLDEHT
jgi:hypothetical protein